jgi:hypothetical protein
MLLKVRDIRLYNSDGIDLDGIDMDKLSCISEGLFGELYDYMKSPTALNYRMRGFGDFYIGYDKTFNKFKEYIKHGLGESVFKESRMAEFNRLLNIMLLYMDYKDDKNDFRKTKVLPQLRISYSGTKDPEVLSYIERLEKLIKLHEDNKREFYDIQYPEVFEESVSKSGLPAWKERYCTESV